MGKLLALLLLTFTIYAVNGNAIEISEKDLIEPKDIAANIDKLIKLVTEKIAEALAYLKEVLEKVIKEAKEAVGNVMGILGNSVQKAIDTIHALEQKAAALGIDVKECVVDNVSQLVGLVQEAQPYFDKCIDSNTKLIGDIYDNAVITIQSQIDIVNDIAAEYHECTNILCYGKVSVKIAEALVEIPILIAKVVANTVQTITSIGIEIGKCIADLDLQYASIIAKTTTSAATCIKEKMQEN